jgi:hypothetical protein
MDGSKMSLQEKSSISPYSPQKRQSVSGQKTPTIASSLPFYSKKGPLLPSMCSLANSKLIFSSSSSVECLSHLKDLLKQLINLQDTVQSSVGPIVAKAYSQPADTLGKRLAKAVGRHQEASLTSAQFLEKTFKKIPSTEEVHKKKVFSPEKAREELLHSLLQNPQIGVMQDRENHLSLRGDFTCLVTHGGPDTVRQTFVLKALQFLAKQKATHLHCA